MNAPVQKKNDLLRIRIDVADRKNLTELVKPVKMDWAGRGPRRQAGGRIIGEALISENDYRLLNKHRDDLVEILENASEVAEKRLLEVGKGDRYQGGSVTPRGLGRKE